MCFDISLANSLIRVAIPEQHLYYLHCLGQPGIPGGKEGWMNTQIPSLQFSLSAQSQLEAPPQKISKKQWSDKG